MATNTSINKNIQSSNNNLENFSLIWIDAGVNDNAENFNAQKYLRKIFNNVQTFDYISQGENYINSQLEQTQFILIVSGRVGYELVPRIHQYSQVLAIYVFCMDQERNREWAQNYDKVKAVITDMNKLISLVKDDQRNRTIIRKTLLTNTTLTDEKSGKKDVYSGIVSSKLKQIGEANNYNNDIVGSQLSLRDLISAGEFEYTELKMKDVAINLVKKFRNEYNRNLNLLILNARYPMMYLLKREQNLSDFIEPLKSLLSKEKKLPCISQRWLVDIMFIYSNRCLCRHLTNLLSKRNPIPMLQPPMNTINDEYRFASNIVHVWDTTRPILLSFGIGECKGKTPLVNTLFKTNFEQSMNSNYFHGTIDIDFGYHFVGRRCINIADAHGNLSIETLQRIQPLFHAFLIHIDSMYFISNTFELIQFLEILPYDVYIMLLIRDLIDEDDENVKKAMITVKSTCSTCQFFCLPDVADKSTYESKNKIEDLREKIFLAIATLSHRNEQNIHKHLRQLMDPIAQKQFEDEENFLNEIRPILIDGKDEDYPLYSLFTRMCHTRIRITRLDPYSVGFDDEELYDLHNTLFKTSEKLKQQQLAGIQATGKAFQVFFQLLAYQNDVFNSLNLLSNELKQKQMRKTSTDEILSFSQRLSLDIHWRNAIISLKNISTIDQTSLINFYYRYILEGYPFEIVDGDNFEMQTEFLTNVLNLFQQKKFFIISIIGPQNSGKSTLLNFLFGSLFEVREGRCTRGVYGTLINIESKVVKNNLILSDYDYILLMDTEGLLSIEKGDEQYDKRLILFCLAVSHLVIVNISGEINETLKQMLILCTQSLKHIEVTRITQPTVHFVLNQKADPNISNCQEQVRIIRDNLIATGLNDVIDLGPNNFHVLSTAFNREPFSVINYDCAALLTDIKFLTDVQKLCKIFVDSSFDIIRKTSSDFSNPIKWIEFADTVLQIVKQYPDLTYFKDIFERKQNQAIRHDIRKDLEDDLSLMKAQELIKREIEENVEQIRNVFKIEQEQTLKDLELKLEKHIGKRAVSENIRKRSFRFLEVQVACRFRSWEVSAIMASERYKLDKMVRDSENELRKLVFNTADGNQFPERTDALARFEQMWTDRFARIEAGFDSSTQWKQSIDLVCRLSDVLDQESLPSVSHILGYLPFLQSFDHSRPDDTFSHNLSEICARCQSEASITNPLVPNSTNIIRTVQNSDLLKQYEFLNNNVLSSICTIREKKTGRTRHEPKQGMQQDFSQQISSKWQTIVQVSHCFELLKERMNSIFQLKINDEHPTEIVLVQDILGTVNKLIQEINRDLNIFNFTVSKSLQSILYTCAVLSTALFYYHRHKTHFDSVIISTRQNKTKWRDRFLRMVIILDNDDENIATNFLDELSEILHQLCDSEIEKFNRNKSENRSLILDRFSIMQELDKQVYKADNDWLMRYVLHPMEIIIEYFDQQWKNVEMAIRQELNNICINVYLERLSEFFRRIKLIQSALQLDINHPLTFVDDLFQLSNNNMDSNSVEKKLCMATIFSQYLLGEPISEEIRIKDGPIYKIHKELRERINNIEKQSNQLKDVFDRMKDYFATYNITYIHAFLENILSRETEMNQIYENYTRSLIDNNCRSISNQLLDRIRHCQAQCPCCKRLCDVDHQLDNGTPIGQGENRHQCQSGHQIRGMGGIRYEVTNEASTIWCEIIRDHDAIVSNRDLRQTWANFKRSHPEWDFGDPKIRETKQTPYVFIWEKIGQQLCDHFGNGMKFVTQNRPIPVHHFIFLLDHSSSMNGGPNFFKRLFGSDAANNTTTVAINSDGKTLTPWEHLLRATKKFIDIRIEKICHTDQMTIVIFGSRAGRIYHRQEVNRINTSKLNISMDICGEDTNFSAAFQWLIETLKELKNDPTHHNIRNTVIFLTDGEPQSFPTSELEILSTVYRPMITRFWTMGLGKYNQKILQQINEKMHGELRNIEQPEDIIETYAEIADFCDVN